MHTDPLIPFHHPNFQVRLLSRDDIPVVQQLLEDCRDFVFLVEGQPPTAQAAQDLFDDLPSGKTQEDKLLFGVFDENEELVGILEGIRGYPDAASWWIGLLLLAPVVRNQALGTALTEMFARLAKRADAFELMLGVVSENRAAAGFWEKQGFKTVRLTEPRTFGKKEQRVIIMRRSLLEHSED